MAGISLDGYERFRQVLRRLGRARMFTAITLITLAVGIGANTVIFSVVEGVLLKPLPYAKPDELIGVGHTALGIGFENLNMSPFIYFTDREQNRTLTDIGVYDGDSLSVTGVGEPEHVSGMDVTDGTLPLLGVQPTLGRLFTKSDDTAGAPETAILSYAYWQKKFGGARTVVGQTIQVDGRPRQIIGVLPKGFRFFDREDDALYLPMQWDRSKTKLGNFSYQALARLKPGVTMEEASADMARLLPIAIRSFPAPEGVSAKIFESARLAPRLRPLKKDVVGDVGEVLWVLMGSIGMVLLIACANVANLLLVRVEGRRQELAIRSALGAGWRAVVGDLLVESATLGLMGSLLGLGLAYGGLKVLVATAPTGLPRIQEIGLDLPVLLFTLVLAVLCSLLIAAIPVFKFGGTQLNSGLREGGGSSSQSRDQHRARNALVVLQVALALVLLICSGLMIRTFLALSHVAPGFEDPHSLQTFRLSVPESKISDAQGERMVRAQQDIQNRIAAVPGVTAVSYGSMVPMSGSNSKDVLTAQDHPDVDAKVPPIRRFKFVAPGYLSTLGTHLVAGRDLTWSETLGKRPVAMISENFAKEYWGSASGAIGKRIRVATLDDWRQIVGVVENVHDDGVNKDAPSTVYWPVLMGNFEGSKERTQGYITFVVRTQRAGSELLMKEVQQAVWSVNPNVPLADVYTLDHFYTRSMARTSFTLVMLSVAGSMALLLGFVGIYGVIAYSVSQRTREIGIRMALGAQRQMIISMFVRNGLVLTAVGVGFGLVAALMAMRLMSSLLFHVSAIDPLTYSVITLAIVVVAYVACYLPSRRAATVDPVDALRSE